jgi:hypothetical protein
MSELLATLWFADSSRSVWLQGKIPQGLKSGSFHRCFCGATVGLSEKVQFSSGAGEKRSSGAEALLDFVSICGGLRPPTPSVVSGQRWLSHPFRKGREMDGAPAIVVMRAKDKSRSFDYAAQKARRSAQDDILCVGASERQKQVLRLRSLRRPPLRMTAFELRMTASFLFS